MKTISIIFIVAGVVGIICDVVLWIKSGKSQLTEILWICSAIMWCVTALLYHNDLEP
jgi:hypothetical protein